jgi:sugar/nucleoside kinase (ribokinase family)
MTTSELDVLGIGNAIVDVIAQEDDAFLERHGMNKGVMTLIDEERAEAIFQRMGPTTLSSGGSAGNTVAGIASLGGKTGFIGKVRDDVLGRAFAHDITALGATFRTPPATSGPATARCLIVVTPDAQRTMNTYLGASVKLGPDDIDAELVRSARVTHLEGYLYDDPSAQEAFVMASEIAHAAGRKVSLSLSDVFCVDRHRAAFLHLVECHVDVLFANELEVASLFQSDDLSASLARLRGAAEVAVVTRGAQGSAIVTGEETIGIDAEPVARVVDTTGAGDLYSAGFLYGLTSGATLGECGRLGSIAAAEVISHIGARPHRPLRELITSKA